MIKDYNYHSLSSAARYVSKKHGLDPPLSRQSIMFHVKSGNIDAMMIHGTDKPIYAIHVHELDNFVPGRRLGIKERRPYTKGKSEDQPPAEA